MAEKNTLSILASIKKKLQKFDEPKKKIELEDEFEYIKPVKKPAEVPSEERQSVADEIADEPTNQAESTPPEDLEISEEIAKSVYEEISKSENMEKLMNESDAEDLEPSDSDEDFLTENVDGDLFEEEKNEEENISNDDNEIDSEASEEQSISGENEDLNLDDPVSGGDFLSDDDEDFLEEFGDEKDTQKTPQNQSISDETTQEVFDSIDTVIEEKGYENVNLNRDAKEILEEKIGAWLNENLAHIVEDIVRDEIRKISSKY
jgi:cell pole-organizing protein PopZ